MSTSKVRTYGSAVALVAAGVVGGAVLAGTFNASAASPSPRPEAGQGYGDSSGRPVNPNPGDESRPQRPDETLLTGDVAEKVKAAVLKEYPGATFVRVETDSDGVYEAHIRKADGTPTTVELDKAFAITGEEQHGPGPGRRHGGRPGGGPGEQGTPESPETAPSSTT